MNELHELLKLAEEFIATHKRLDEANPGDIVYATVDIVGRFEGRTREGDVIIKSGSNVRTFPPYVFERFYSEPEECEWG